MSKMEITAVGIDVSKGKSTVAVRRPGGEIVMMPFTVLHTAKGLTELTNTLRSISGEIRIVMEHTGMYWRPIALALKEGGFFVSVVNAMLIHDFSDNSIRKVKTDRADSLKIANYALTFWQELRDYSVEDETRQMLKIQSRLYERTLNSSIALRNGLISLLDQTFPGANKLFDEQRTKSGHIKWVDFVRRFWHKDCVAALSFSSFADTFQKWCKRTGYHYSLADVERIHGIARNSVATLTKNDSTKLLITQAVDSLNAVYDTLQTCATRCSVWPRCCLNMRSLWQCKEPGQLLGLSSWRRLAMCAASQAKVRWWLSPVWTLRRFSRELLIPNLAMFQREDLRISDECCLPFAA